MSKDKVLQLLQQARTTRSDFYKLITQTELDGAWQAALVPEGRKIPGKPIDAEEAEIFRALRGSDSLTPMAKERLEQLLGELPRLLEPDPSQMPTVEIPPKMGHRVYLSEQTGLSVDAFGTRPANPVELTSVLYDAGGWLQASFGSPDNLFSKLSDGGRRAVLAQFAAAMDESLAELSEAQQDQLLGSAGALAAELLKSTDDEGLRAEAFQLLARLLDDSRLSVLARRGLAGYFQQSQSFRGCLTEAQAARVDELHGRLFPKAPFDYAAWDARGKSVITVDHSSGQGEGFLEGYCRQLLEQGLGGTRFQLVSGDIERGPALLRAVIRAGDPLNEWGRDMTLEMRVRNCHDDLYKGMADEQVDIVSYGGHSNFGATTLNSLSRAPEQRGPKMILRDLCCGADTKNAEAHCYPEAALNSITSVNSSFFRTSKDSRGREIATDCEGYDAMMSALRGVLGKEDWKTIDEDLLRRANWSGHDSKNNWTTPADPRAGSFCDDDGDGIPNVFDLLPCYDTTAIESSSAAEFALQAPEVPVDRLPGRAAFQAIQAINTSTNYNPVLNRLNSGRKLCTDPRGLWFDASEDPSTYVRLRTGDDGRFYLQLSSALATMSVEALRAVLGVELVRHLATLPRSPFKSVSERNAMALLLAAGNLEHDLGSRDKAIFQGIVRLYGFPESIAFGDFRQQIVIGGEDHDYFGNAEAMRTLVDRYRADFERPGAGEPAQQVRFA